MIGLVVATHGNLGSELLLSAQMIIGPVINARSVSITHDSSMEAIRDAIAEAVAAVGKDDHGVIIVTDMFGGTPSNLSYSFLEEGNIEVISGVNLPMMIKAAKDRKNSKLSDFVSDLELFGKKSISLASRILKGNKRG